MSSRPDADASPHTFEVLGEEGFLVSDDPARIDLDVVHGYLSRSYWSRGIPRDIVEKAVRSSLVFGLYHSNQQVGFARVVTDRTTFAYLCDVFVLEDFQGRGLGKRLMEAVFAHPDLQGLRRFMLATQDAHGLYEKFGFRALKNPERFMEKHDPDIYQRR